MHSRMKRLVAYSSLTLVATGMLAGCATAPLPNLVVPWTTAMPNAQIATTVAVPWGASMAQIEARHKGKVMVWRPDRQFAILGSNELPASAARALQAASGGQTEPNKKRFLASNTRTWMNGISTLWAEGISTLWAEGISTLWAEGISTLWAEGTYRVMPQNTQVWQQIKLEDAQRAAPNLGRNVKVAVIDTGIDMAHPMFADALVDPSQMWDFVDNDAVPQDVGSEADGGYGHGSAVAGIILQIAPAAQIMPLRVLGADGSGDVTHLAAAIDWAVQKGVQVINLSLGSQEVSPAVEAALQTATAQGVLVVSSAGNANAATLSYPASRAHVDNDNLGWQHLSVTSIDSVYQKSNFANFNAGLELAAPGENVFAPFPNGRIASWSGTSMAAPMASGALVLALGQPLSVPVRDLADKLHQSVGGELYNNSINETYKDQVGKGNLDLKTFVENVVNN
jgi:thermitase